MSGHGSILEALGIAAVVGGMIFGSYFAAWRVLAGVRWRRPPRLPTEPIPPSWRGIIERGVPIASRLTVAEHEKLLRLVQVFLRDKRIEGCDGLEVTEEMKVTIAAQACVLLLHLDAGCYPGLRTVLLYPGTYQPRSPTWFKYDLGSTEARLGESWRHGVVILSWDAVAAGATHGLDGQNVTLHEFAHQLDQADGVADGVPVLATPSAVRNWAAVIGRHYDDLVADRARPRLGPRSLWRQEQGGVLRRSERSVFRAARTTPAAAAGAVRGAPPVLRAGSRRATADAAGVAAFQGAPASDRTTAVRPSTTRAIRA